jgi:hypothetical protein
MRNEYLSFNFLRGHEKKTLKFMREIIFDEGELKFIDSQGRDKRVGESRRSYEVFG